MFKFKRGVVLIVLISLFFSISLVTTVHAGTKTPISVIYRASVTNCGWLTTVGNGITMGAPELGYMEKLQIAIPVKDGIEIEYAKGNIDEQGRAVTEDLSKVIWIKDGEILAGKLESIRIRLVNGKGLNVFYRTFIDGAWTAWTRNGWSTPNQSYSRRKPILAVQIKIESTVDIRTSVYATGIGWRDWSKFNLLAPTSKLSSQIEAIRLGEANTAQGVTVTHNYKSTETGKYIQSDMPSPANDLTDYPYLQYRAYTNIKGWSTWIHYGQKAGIVGEGLHLEAIQVKYDSDVHDIIYRVYVEGKGWTSWSRNGATSGEIGKRILAIQVTTVPK